MKSTLLRSTAGLIVVALALSGCSSLDPSATTLDVAPLADIRLEQDGLGDILLGVPPEAVVADVSALFGEPDLDSDWVRSEPNIYGTCPGAEMRAIGWGSLVTIFVRDDADELGGRFYTYTYGYDYQGNTGGVDPRGLDLKTADGIGLGSTVTELTSAFGEDLIVDGDEALDVWSFRVEGSEMTGLLSGPAESDSVTLIELATGCSN